MKTILIISIIPLIFASCIYYYKSELLLAQQKENKIGTEYSLQKLNENVTKARIEKFSMDSDSIGFRNEYPKYKMEKSKTNIKAEELKEATDERKYIQAHCCKDGY